MKVPKYIKEDIKKIKKHRALMEKARVEVDKWIFKNVENKEKLAEIQKELDGLENGMHVDDQHIISFLRNINSDLKKNCK
ncbi:MAG: hypothetical protein ACOCRX_05105 [Candidatus Woesearchaeota archaeon]